MQQPTYRPDIDGLRAFAVLAVIFYHFGLGGFSGGYVGVDVFFVISGFLITQILVREHEKGQYSIVKFYERRVRRIIPALLVMLALTLAAGWLFLAPAEYSDLGKSTLSALAFVSNIKFWRGSGYFDAAAVRPILHTWSLAVEEQFYIAYPLVLALLYRVGRRWIGPVILFALFASLALAVVGVFLSPSATFFLIPTRAWELMIGAVLALGLVPAIKTQRMAELVAVSGAVMLAASVALYDQRTLFPGASALLPCLGTAFLIHSGSDQQTRIKSVLSWPPIVTVGLMSYSLYLYHFPIHIYAERLLFRPLTSLDAALGIALTFLLAFLSWRYVERPFRQRGKFSRRQIFLSGALGSLAIAIPSVFVAMSDGAAMRFSAKERNILAAANDLSWKGQICLNLAVSDSNRIPECHFGYRPGGGLGSFLLVGDSHAAALMPAVEIAARRDFQSGTIFAFNSCPPLVGTESVALSKRDAAKCAKHTADWLALAKSPSVKTILITAYWSAHLENWNAIHDDGERYMAQAIDRTLKALPGKKIVFLLDVPRSDYPLWVEYVLGPRLGHKPSLPKSSGNDRASQVIRNVARGRATVVDMSAAFCDSQKCRALDSHGRPILVDRNHITESAGRESLGQVLAQALADARK